MKKIISIWIVVATIFQAKSQEKFVKNGIITFEKSVNTMRTLEGSTYSEEYKNSLPTYIKSIWEYQFNANHALYKEALKNMTNNTSLFFSSSESTDKMYTNFKEGNRLINIKISGVDYLLKDTIPQLKWKILQEIRMIAGYETRKATAVFNDSVTVVAFFSEEILPRGGPEGFTGLPGMILGLAIPQYFTTWFANKVDIVPESSLKITVPNKGQKAETDAEFKKLSDSYHLYRTTKKSPEELRKIIYGLTL